MGTYPKYGTPYLAIWEGETLLWTDIAPNVTSSELTAFLLFRLEDGDYLLQYTPSGSMGICVYTYCLFDLTGAGGNPVRTARENEVIFPFAPEQLEMWERTNGSVDTAAVAAFEAELNELLSHSVILLDTTMKFDGQTAPLRSDALEMLAYLYQEDGPLPFDRPMELEFSSGAGAWSTMLLLHPDGSFRGDYHDTDMGADGEGYPNGTEYICQFHGRFGDIQQVSDASWSMTLEELVLDTGRPIGEEWIADGVKYVSSSPYGMDVWGSGPLEPGAAFFFYTPEATSYAPGTELYGMIEYDSDWYDPDWYDFWIWWPHRHAFAGPSDVLGCYGLRSVETGYGFFG